MAHAQLNEAVKALNESGLLAEPLPRKCTEDQFIAGVDTVPEEDDESIPQLVIDVYNAILDARELGDAPPELPAEENEADVAEGEPPAETQPTTTGRTNTMATKKTKPATPAPAAPARAPKAPTPAAPKPATAAAKPAKPAPAAKPAKPAPATKKPLKEPKAKAPVTEWGHRLDAQAGKIDQLVARKMKPETIAERLGLPITRVNAHLYHLKVKHNIEVKK